MATASHLPPAGITFLAGLDRDLRQGLANEIRALWTHTSTALEGNTLTLGDTAFVLQVAVDAGALHSRAALTLGDTAFVLQEGLTVSGKPIKDHQEVIGHARAIDLIYAIIDQRRRVTADDLHALHRAVQTEAVADAFQPTGRWKVEPNGTTALLSSGSTRWHEQPQAARGSAGGAIRGRAAPGQTRTWDGAAGPSGAAGTPRSGEVLLEYARPDHVPILMDVWLDQLARARDRAAGDRMDHYTDLHLGFTAIHPYADGNGRMARLLANIPVIEGGDPPVLIPWERRRDYLTRMGDWSIARQAPSPGETLVPGLPERERLHAFFVEVARPAMDLVAAYRGRQAERRRRGA